MDLFIRRRHLIDTVAAVLAACALGIGIGAIRRVYRRATHEPSAGLAPATWRALQAGGHVLGAREARVTVVDFGDFECFACAQVERTLAQIRRAHPGAVREVFLHYPLGDVHPWAWEAATAAECAADQGRFAAYHDLLVQSQTELGAHSWLSYAESVGVSDTGRFVRCLRDPVTARRIERDTSIAHSLRVTLTPTLFIDRAPYSAGLSRRALDSAVRDALEGSESRH